MLELLYIKYNSHRKPEYQLSTRIVSDNGIKRVIKMPLNEAAKGKIEDIKENYKILRKYYNTIKVIPCRKRGDGISFDFIEGQSLVNGFDFERDSIESICRRLVPLINEVLDANDDYICDFKLTNEFKTVFPDCIPSGKALKVCNLDSILSNFIRSDGSVFCIDYEWVMEFPIPIDYLKYRILKYLYNDNASYLSKRIELSSFFECMSLSKNDIDLFDKMEDCFQQYVHGDNRTYNYLDNYKKNTVDLATYVKRHEETVKHVNNQEKIIADKDLTIQNLNDMVSAKDSHIDNLETELSKIKEEKIQQARDYDALLQYEIKRRDNDIIYRDGLLRIKDEQLSRLTKMTRNPIYWAYCLIKKVCRKIYYLIETDNQRKKREEIERVGIYKYKYRDLMEYDNKDYESWIERVENAYPKQRKLKYNPKISVLVPVYNVLDKHLIPCIESVINQTYKNWELCLADDNSTWDNVKETLSKYENNPQIKIIYRKENGHISEATNSALELATGEFVGLLDCDDLLSPNALYEIAKKLNENRELDFIYSDEDKIDDEGNHRHMPHFKPDWSPDTLMSNMYTCHFTVYRKCIVEKVGGLRSECNGSQDYDLALRVMDETIPRKIAHIDKILYHWREREESTSGNATVKPYVFEAAKKAKLDSLERRGLRGRVEFVDEMYQYNVIYDVEGFPKVSIIIPSKDNYSVLKRCIDSLYEYTTYHNFEVILVDNGSKEENKNKYKLLSEKYGFKYVYNVMDFNFSKMCNIGVKESVGEYILLLNDDIEILKESRDWLSIMLGQAQLPYAGAVGAKLLYPDSGNIQHVGVINIENGPVHAFSGMSDEYIYYFGRNRLNYNVLCVTAACLLVNKDKYNRVNGLDDSFAVAYNDVDFCMKLTEAGYYNVVRNDVKLFHHESVSRGDDLEDINKTRRLMKEESRLYDGHPSYAHYDPFYNRYLTMVSADFSYNYNDYKLIDSEVKETVSKQYEEMEAKWEIDAISVERYVYIEGWIYDEKLVNNNDIKPKVLLINGEKTYEVKTNKVYRKDLDDNNKNVEFSGFVCRFNREKITEGSYNICLYYKKGVVYTNKSIDM